MPDLIKRGSVAGLSAGIAVAAGVLVYDLFSLEPFATPDALARNITGAPVLDAADVGAAAWIGIAIRHAYGLLLYSIAHLTIFAAVGVFGAWLFGPGRLAGNIFTGALFGMVVGSGVFYTGYGLLAPSFVEVPAWQLIVAMNAVAGVVLVAQLVGDREDTADSLAESSA